MDRRLFTALARGLAILAVLPVAHAEVYQCVAPSGALLLTDRACPGGYQTRFVVDEPQREVPPAAPAETAPAPRRAAKGDGERLAAVEAEMDRLREQLELERMRGELMLEQLRLANRELEDRDEPAIGYGVVGSILVPRYPSWHRKPGGPGKPCLDCAEPDGKVNYHPRERWRDCGTFGCTPSITHAPSDYATRTRDPGPVIRPAPRPGAHPAPARGDARPISQRMPRP